MSVTLVDRSSMADLAEAAAVASLVCVRPHVRMVIDRATGESQMVPIPCGSTRESKCPSCATKARLLRIHQCREGWHREDEPAWEPSSTNNEPDSDVFESDRGVDVDESGGVDVDGLGGRRVRSTRRIAGFPDLPRVPVADMEDRTVGRVFVDEIGGQLVRSRPSMFITLTLPSYGKVRDGVPLTPDRYDYRRAALDALTFSRLIDRFWQNLRRCAGYKVQYFSAIEAQHRLAPHLHAAVRGAIPRATVKAVVAGTYFAAWWPPIDDVVYTEETGFPVWDAALVGYVDPLTGKVLPTWERSVRDLDKPMHIASFGTQIDVKGLLGGTEGSERTVRYLCKYLTKSVADTYAPNDPARVIAYEQHVRRLHAQTLILPCGPSCSNWLRYGITPKNPTAGMTPGRCPSPAHDRENLGIGGRRVLVSRQWSGKTLTEHRADRADVVREVLETAGITTPDIERLSATHTLPDGTPRFEWRDPDPIHLDYTAIIGASLHQAITWRRQYDLAKQGQTPNTGPPPNPVDNQPAITHETKE